MSTNAVPEAKYVDIGDGLKIHYHEAGEGYPVLFLHGSGPGASGWSNFKGNFPYFAKNGFRALIPDTLGFGYSSKPDTMDYGMDVVVNGVKRMLDALGIEKCAVIGNSHGGAMDFSRPCEKDHHALPGPAGRSLNLMDFDENPCVNRN